MSILSPAEVIKRADAAIADISTGGGKLSTEQASTFIKAVFDQPIALNEIHKVKMGAPEREHPKVALGSRLLQAPSGEHTGLSEARRSKPTYSKVTLTSKKYLGQIFLPMEHLTDTVEGGSFVQTLYDIAAKQIAIDASKALWYGDTVGTWADPDDQAFYRLQDGLFKIATTNTFSHASAAVNDALFGNAVKALPPKYRGDMSKFRFYMHPNCAQNWRALVASRSTPGGDAVLGLGGAIPPGGIPPYGSTPVVAEPTITSSGGVASAMLTYPENVLWGIYQDVTITRYDRPIEDDVAFCFKMRMAFAVENEDALVEVTNILTA